jgi:hypothetical protein
MHASAVVLLAALAWQPGRIPVAPACETLIAGHLRAIEERGWAVVTPGDLYHAHLVLRPGAPEQFPSSAALCAAVVVVLYHSDEMLVRWRLDDGDLPVARRRPRSIVGFPDGSVVAASSLFADPYALPDYESSGTVHLSELARERPTQFGPRADRAVLSANSRCLVDQIVDIGGFPRRMTMECYPPRH